MLHSTSGLLRGAFLHTSWTELGLEGTWNSGETKVEWHSTLLGKGGLLPVLGFNPADSKAFDTWPGYAGASIVSCLSRVLCSSRALFPHSHLCPYVSPPFSVSGTWPLAEVPSSWWVNCDGHNNGVTPQGIFQSLHILSFMSVTPAWGALVPFPRTRDPPSLCQLLPFLFPLCAKLCFLGPWPGGQAESSQVQAPIAA